MERFLNLHRVIENTLAEGPGRRFCLWTQGCLLRCPGCCNSAMQPIFPALMVPTQELIERLRLTHETHHLEGITFLGGEPFLQAQSLIPVAREARKLGLTVLVFSGYEREFLETNKLPGSCELLSLTDVLIDGPYLSACADHARNWVGSTNQRFHYLTSAYSPEIETDPRYHHIIELRFTHSDVTVNGCPQIYASPKNR